MDNSILKKWFFASFFLLFVWHIQACDVCGCSVFNQNLGILPQFNTHFLGIRYSQRGFRSEHPSILFPTVSHEQYHNAELFGRYVIGQRWQILGFLPYNIIKKKENGIIDISQGIGDAYIMGLYSIIHHKESESGDLYQNLQIGGGIKLPTGHSDFETQEYGWIPGVQIGTGTTDFLSTATYILRYKSWGVVTEAGVRITTENNKYQHRFGNGYNQSIRLLKVFDSNNWTFMPTLGLVHERWNPDQKEGYDVDLTGGNITSTSIGIDILFSNFNIGIAGHLPVHQNIGRGYINSQSRFNGQLIYFF